MKSLLLVGALLFAPMVNEEIDNEEPEIVVVEGEGETETETPEVEEEPKEEVVEENEEPKEEVAEVEDSDEDEKTTIAIIEGVAETLEWWKTFLATLGISVGGLSLSSIIALIVVALRSIANSMKLKKSKMKTLEDVQDAVLKEVSNCVKKEMDASVVPMIEQVEKTLVNTKDLQKVITKIVALSQENSPASRLAILECIASLGVADKSVIEDAKESIEEEIKTEQEIKDDANKKLDDIITETEIKEEPKTENEMEEYLKGL